MSSARLARLDAAMQRRYVDSGHLPGISPYRWQLLHLFPRDSDPEGRLVFDGSGNLDGITHGAVEHGGQRGGTVFELSPDSVSQNWKYTLLYNFCPFANNCADGSGPLGGMIIDASGNLYGVTDESGAGPGQSLPVPITR
jgi:hypothetical protein